MLNLNQREIANEMEYDYIFCLSERIYNILKLEGYPVLQLNYFVTPKDIEKLIMYDFKRDIDFHIDRNMPFCAIPF